jgi:hypothetical protein
MSGIYPVRLREDLPRDVAGAYWAGPHAEIVRRLPHIVEYRQHHFSATDHGYWPAIERVGTLMPPSWPVDGIAEVRFRGLLAALSLLAHLGGVRHDEQNVFERCHGYIALPGSGRWWSCEPGDPVGHRTVLLIRRRVGVSRRAFGAFLHDELGRALVAGGARELRTYAFMPWTVLAHATPGVSHDNPPHRRYHGAVVLGVARRSDVDALVARPEVAEVIQRQGAACTAVHAFSVDETVPVVGSLGEEAL